MKQCLLLLLSFGACIVAFTQNYHAVQGSSNEAGLNVGNNPAAIVNSPFTWDITLFGTQLKSITNAFTIHNYSLLSSPGKSEYALDNGEYARKADISFNTNLLNARFALSRKRALAFGINLRGYASLHTGSYNYTDTLRDINDFIRINELTPSLNGQLASSSWIEIFGTYGQTVLDNETGRLNAAVTLKVNRGLSGATARVTDVAVNKDLLPDGINYALRSGRVDYGYSSNYDHLQSNQPGAQNTNDFLSHTEGGASLDLGVEYLIKTQAVTSFHDDDDGYYEYEWKIGVSLLDIGFASYKYGRNSFIAANPKSGITSGMLEDKFYYTDNIEDFKDSLATVVQSFTSRRGKFGILHPARAVLNVDKYLLDNFFINADLSLNLSTLAGGEKAYVRELNLLTVTPRWETRLWAAYLPLQYNNGGKFWVGAAFKAGPLLLGIHNLSNIFSKTSVQDGGGYLAIIIRPWKTRRWGKSREVYCP